MEQKKQEGSKSRTTPRTRWSGWQEGGAVESGVGGLRGSSGVQGGAEVQRSQGGAESMQPQRNLGRTGGPETTCTPTPVGQGLPSWELQGRPLCCPRAGEASQTLHLSLPPRDKGQCHTAVWLPAKAFHIHREMCTDEIFIKETLSLSLALLFCGFE